MKAWVAAIWVAAAAQAEPPLPVYPGAIHTRIGSDLVIGGEHFRMAYFTTGDGLTQVATYFLQEWKEGGFPTAADGDFETEIIVSAFDTRQGFQRSIALIRQGRETIGFSVLRDLWLREAAGPDEDPLAPEGSLFSESLISRGEGAGLDQLSALLDRDLSVAADETRERFRHRGFPPGREEKLEGKVGPGRLFEHVRNGKHVQTVLTPASPRTTALVETWFTGPPVRLSSEDGGMIYPRGRR